MLRGMARMIPKNPPNPVPKRGRGRPLGSAPYRQRDEELLVRYADKAIHSSGLELAPFARRAGVSNAAAIRRLQARWRADRERFLNDARTRFDARPPESLWQMLMDLRAGLSRMAAIVSREVLDPLRASIRRAERRWDARASLGQPARLPFDPADPSELEPALARFESAMPTPGSDEIDDQLGDQTLADLPLSQRLYLPAVLIHEMSLEQRRRETEASRSTSGDRDGERR